MFKIVTVAAVVVLAIGIAGSFHLSSDVWFGVLMGWQGTWLYYNS